MSYSLETDHQISGPFHVQMGQVHFRQILCQ